MVNSNIIHLAIGHSEKQKIKLTFCNHSIDKFLLEVILKILKIFKIVISFPKIQKFLLKMPLTANFISETYFKNSYDWEKFDRINR